MDKGLGRFRPGDHFLDQTNAQTLDFPTLIETG